MAHSSTQPVSIDTVSHLDPFVDIEETAASPYSSDGSVSLVDWSSVSDRDVQRPQPRPSIISARTAEHPVPNMQALAEATETLVIEPRRSNDERYREPEEQVTDDLNSSIVFATPRSDLADSMTLPDSADRRSNAAPETQPTPYPYPASSPASPSMSRQSTSSAPPLSSAASTTVDTSLSTIVATPITTKANPLVVNTETPRVAQGRGGDSPVELRQRQSPHLHRSPSSNSALSYLTQPVTSRDRTSFAAPQSFSNPSFLVPAPPPRNMTPDHIADFGGSLSESRRTGGRVDERRFSPLHSELEQDMREWFQPDRGLSPEAHVRFDDLFGGDWPADPYERTYSSFAFKSQATAGSSSRRAPPLQSRANPPSGAPLTRRFSTSSPTESEVSSTYQRTSWNRNRSSGLTVASMMTSDTQSPGVETRSARLTLTPSPAPTDSMHMSYPSVLPEPASPLDRHRAVRPSWAEATDRDMRARCYTPASDSSTWEPPEVMSSPAPAFHAATGSTDMRADESPRSKRPLPDVPGGRWGSPEPSREQHAEPRPRSPLLLSTPWTPPTYVPAGTSLFDTNEQPATRQERHSRAPLPPVPSVQPIPLPPQSSAMQQPTTLHRRFSDFPYPARPASLSNQPNWPDTPFVAPAYPSYPPHPYSVQENQASFNTSSYIPTQPPPNPRASMGQPYPMAQSYPQPACQQHSRFWFADGMLVFLVEDTEVRVHRHFFEVHSSVFKSVFTSHTLLNPGSSGPLVYNLNWEKIKLVDFERLLAIFYPNDFAKQANSTTEEWASVLFLATKWDFASVKQLALDKLSSIATPVERILISKQYNLSERRWVLDALKELCGSEDALTLDDGEKLGMRTVMNIWRMQCAVRRMRKRCSDVSDETAGCSSCEVGIEEMIVERLLDE